MTFATMNELQRIRRAAGWSQEKTAVECGVSSPTVRVYEANPDAIKDEAKKASLDRTYAMLRARAKNQTAGTTR
jgi:transcriptional regulator with XRE-family HTH domain